MNQTIINTVLPQLIPLIGDANSDVVKGVIDVYHGMGGTTAAAALCHCYSFLVFRFCVCFRRGQPDCSWNRPAAGTVRHHLSDWC